MKNIILIGPPGCGKGTQSSFLVKNHNFAQISTGDILRDIVKTNSPLALKVDEIMKTGNMISDEIIIELISQKIKSVRSLNYSGIILDGFPRNISQAYSLNEILEKLEINLDKVIELKVEKDYLLNRVIGRFTCVSCKESYNKFSKPTLVTDICDNCQSREFESRTDDTEEIVSKRLNSYMEITKPVVDYYKGLNILQAVDASQDIHKVSEEISLVLNL